MQKDICWNCTAKFRTKQMQICALVFIAFERKIFDTLRGNKDEALSACSQRCIGQRATWVTYTKYHLCILPVELGTLRSGIGRVRQVEGGVECQIRLVDRDSKERAAPLFRLSLQDGRCLCRKYDIDTVLGGVRRRSRRLREGYGQSGPEKSLWTTNAPADFADDIRRTLRSFVYQAFNEERGNCH